MPDEHSVPYDGLPHEAFTVTDEMKTIDTFGIHTGMTIDEDGSYGYTAFVQLIGHNADDKSVVGRIDLLLNEDTIRNLADKLTDSLHVIEQMKKGRDTPPEDAGQDQGGVAP